jgi:hypothetical protein
MHRRQSSVIAACHVCMYLDMPEMHHDIIRVAEIVDLREVLSSSWQDTIDEQRASRPDQGTQILMSAFSSSSSNCVNDTLEQPLNRHWLTRLRGPLSSEAALGCPSRTSQGSVEPLRRRLGMYLAAFEGDEPFLHRRLRISGLTSSSILQHSTHAGRSNCPLPRLAFRLLSRGNC